MIEVVKVQVPLNRPGPALIYPNPKGERMRQQTLGAAAKRSLKGDFKAFFEAEFTQERWRLIRRVEDQEW